MQHHRRLALLVYTIQSPPVQQVAQQETRRKDTWYGGVEYILQTGDMLGDALSPEDDNIGNLPACFVHLD